MKIVPLIWFVKIKILLNYDKYLEIHDYLVKHRGKGKNNDDIVALLEVIK